MNYPLISEYVEAIKAAEDNFDQLKHLRPVIGDDGEPVMTSGNFAVVFKMKDEQIGKFYAVKCFTKEQEGRAEAYKLITEELAKVESPFILSIKYLEKELFVDTMQTNEIEFPVLLMDWVEGTTLDKYIRENLEDKYTLEMLAYRFSQLAQWLMPQPFAHGDLKPDNILVRENGTLVLVDYDGMYVPAMKGQKARELGSPDFRHPLRTVDDFDEHIDDFSIVTILLSLKAISLQPSLLEKYGAADRLLFSKRDYCNLSASKSIVELHSLTQDSELATLQSLFILSSTRNNLSLVSSHLLNISLPPISQYKVESFSTKVTEHDLANAWTDEYGVTYSVDRKRLLRAENTFDSNRYIIHNEVQVICYGAFEWCRKLTEAPIPNSVGFIGEHAFSGCCNMTNIVIPDSVTTIGEGAFSNCEKLRCITIPRSVTSIGRGVFSGIRMNGDRNGACAGYNNLERIIVDINNPKYDSRDNCNAIIETQSNTLIAGCQNTVIPNGIASIDSWAFEGCVRLTKIVIPGSVASIPDSVFEFCYGLTSVTLLNGITTIGKMAFYGCNKLSAIVFPDSITSIGDQAFAGCDKLTSITIPQSVSYIGVEAFAGMDSIDNYQGFFNGRNNIKSIKVDERNTIYDSRCNCNAIIETISNTLIAGCGNTIIPNGVKTIGRSAFAYCEELVAIEIPEGVIEIMDYAFFQCKSLKKVVLPNSIKKIGKNAFGADVNCGMYGIEIIPNICVPFGSKSKFNELLAESKGYLLEDSMSTEVTEKDQETAWVDEYGVRYSAFKNRLLKAPESIKEYTIRMGTKVVCARAFNNYNAVNYPYLLSSIIFPNTVTAIGSGAFSGCRSLTSITIPKSVTYIGEWAFSGCSDLTSVVISSSVTFIGKGAFSGCVGIERITVESGNPVYDSRDKSNAIIDAHSNTLIVGCKKTVIPHSVTGIGDSAFSSCKGIKSITIPESVTQIGDWAFNGCEKLISITIPNSVIAIGKGAFSNCRVLNSISIPNSVITIGEDAFRWSDSLVSIYIPVGTRNKFEQLLPEYKDKLFEEGTSIV